MSDFIVRDYFQEKMDRITYAWEDSEVFKKYLKLNSEQALVLQQTLKDLYEKRWIDTAEGKQLDIIGNIVGQPRELLDADLLTFFGMQRETQADSFGSLGNPSVGSDWWHLGQKTTGNITLDDEAYRLFIKAKIIKNTTSATPEDLIKFANFVFDTKGSTVLEEDNASFTLLIGKALSRQDIGLLKYRLSENGYESSIIPKPTGVRININSYQYDAFFAFQGVPNAKGFGEIDEPLFDGEYDYDGTLRGDPELVSGVGGQFMEMHGEL